MPPSCVFAFSLSPRRAHPASAVRPRAEKSAARAATRAAAKAIELGAVVDDLRLASAAHNGSANGVLPKGFCCLVEAEPEEARAAMALVEAAGRLAPRSRTAPPAHAEVEAVHPRPMAKAESRAFDQLVEAFEGEAPDRWAIQLSDLAEHLLWHGPDGPEAAAVIEAELERLVASSPAEQRHQRVFLDAWRAFRKATAEDPVKEAWKALAVVRAASLAAQRRAVQASAA